MFEATRREWPLQPDRTVVLQHESDRGTRGCSKISMICNSPLCLFMSLHAFLATSNPGGENKKKRREKTLRWGDTIDQTLINS